MALQLIFGMTYSNLDDYLLFGKRIIVKVLRNDHRARVRIPSSEKIEEYKQMVQSRHQFLPNVWCTMDGLKLLLEQTGDSIIQERYYNGWTHDHYVSSVLCFCPDGTIPICYINIPGCVHDSQIASVCSKVPSFDIQDVFADDANCILQCICHLLRCNMTASTLYVYS